MAPDEVHEVMPIQVGHSQVGEDEARAWAIIDALHGVHPVHCDRHCAAQPFESGDKRLPKVFIVVNQEDPTRAGHP